MNYATIFVELFNTIGTRGAIFLVQSALETIWWPGSPGPAVGAYNEAPGKAEE